MTDTRKLSIWIGVLAVGLCASLILHVATAKIYGEMILEDQKVAWCGVDIAMGKKSHPRQCGILK